MKKYFPLINTVVSVNVFWSFAKLYDWLWYEIFTYSIFQNEIYQWRIFENFLKIESIYHQTHQYIENVGLLMMKSHEWSFFTTILIDYFIFKNEISFLFAKFMRIETTVWCSDMINDLNQNDWMKFFLKF